MCVWDRNKSARCGGVYSGTLTYEAASVNLKSDSRGGV